MVTHDVALKEFADRVIWMSDGKIKYVEQVDPVIQKQRIQKLQEDTEVRIPRLQISLMTI